MTHSKMNKRQRFPPEIIQYAVRLYLRFNLSHRAVEGSLAERCMRKFKSPHQARRFLNAHAAVYNLFNLGRHLVTAENHRFLRQRAFESWEKAVGV